MAVEMRELGYARPEVEVAANVVWLLKRAGLLAMGDIPSLRRVCETVGLEPEDLRLASVREELRNLASLRPSVTGRLCPLPDPVEPVESRAVPAPVAAIPAAASMVAPEPTRPAEHSTAPQTAPRVVPAVRPEPVTRQCSGCRKVRDLTIWFAKRPFAPGGRATRCVECEVDFVVRSIRQRRLLGLASVTLTAEDGDECVGMACGAGCGHPIRVGESMVVESAPRHEVCP